MRSKCKIPELSFIAPPQAAVVWQLVPLPVATELSKFISAKVVVVAGSESIMKLLVRIFGLRSGLLMSEVKVAGTVNVVLESEKVRLFGEFP
jgi:hypothetical protein